MGRKLTEKKNQQIQTYRRKTAEIYIVSRRRGTIKAMGMHFYFPIRCVLLTSWPNNWFSPLTSLYLVDRVKELMKESKQSKMERK